MRQDYLSTSYLNQKYLPSAGFIIRVRVHVYIVLKVAHYFVQMYTYSIQHILYCLLSLLYLYPWLVVIYSIIFVWIPVCVWISSMCILLHARDLQHPLVQTLFAL